MLQFTYLKQPYSLDLLEGHMYGTAHLDENWRELDYKNGGNFLDIGVSLFFSATRDQIRDLANYGLVSSDSPTALLNLDLSIGHCKYNFKTHRSEPISGLKAFPAVEDFQRFSADSNILEASTLWFPGMPQLVNLTSMQLDQSGASGVSVSFAGNTEDIRGKLDFSVEVSQLPFEITFRIDGAPGSFTGKNIQQRFQEIEDCFSSIYDRSQYSSEECVTDETTQGVAIKFKRG